MEAEEQHEPFIVLLANALPNPSLADKYQMQ
jgi:hypothetical protein